MIKFIQSGNIPKDVTSATAFEDIPGEANKFSWESTKKIKDDPFFAVKGVETKEPITSLSFDRDMKVSIES